MLPLNIAHKEKEKKKEFEIETFKNETKRKGKEKHGPIYLIFSVSIYIYIYIYIYIFFSLKKSRRNKGQCLTDYQQAAAHKESELTGEPKRANLKSKHGCIHPYFGHHCRSSPHRFRSRCWCGATS